MPFRCRFLLLTAALVLCLAARGLLASGVSADSLLLQSSPAGNAVLTAPPTEVSLTFSAPIDVASSKLTVFGQDHKAVETIGFALDGPNRLRAGLPTLAKGAYSVVWSARAAAGNQETGAFGFALDPTGASPKLVQQPKPVAVLTPLPRAIIKWLAFLTVMAFIGAMVLRFAATRAAVATVAPAEERARLAESTDRKLLMFGGLMLFLFVFAWLSQIVYEAGALAKVGWWQSFHWSYVSKLFDTPAGHIRERQLIIVIVAALVFVPYAFLVVTRILRYNPVAAGLVMFVGMTACILELLVGTLPATHPPEVMRAYFTSLLDWGHLMSGAIWLGGLAALLMVALTVRPSQCQQAFWATLIRRFSLIATLSVALTIPTGLWTFWIHVGDPMLLFSTLYGKTLLIKLVLVASLVGIGGFNQVWLLPRIEEVRAAGPRLQSYGDMLLGHFRKTITVEVMIGAAVLLLVPFLSGSARNQDFQQANWDTTRIAMAGSMQVKLKPSALQPGLADYEVTAPPTATRVAITFSSKALGVPATDVLALGQGGGSFRATGIYTPMVGVWQAVVHVTGADKQVQDASFTLPIRADAIASRAPAPPINASTWLFGAFEVGLAWAAILAGSMFSRHLTSRRTGGAVLADSEPAA